MDLDADGEDDLISGSYRPGNLFVFRGLGGGEFAAGEKLQDATGELLYAGGKRTSEDDSDKESLAAAPFAHDWDGDGDLDLLVGNIRGHVVLIENEGTAREAKFAPEERVQLQAAGKTIEVPAGDAGPVVADWNGDGLPDLLVGCGDGSVRFYPNVGERKQPRLGKETILIEKPGNDLSRREPKRSGKRAKLCVTDYDGDGHDDLLVGDFVSSSMLAPRLTPEQEKEFEGLLARERELIEQFSALREELDDDEAPEIKALLEQLSEVQRGLIPLRGGREYHGWVWFYRRKPAEDPAGS